MTPPVLLVLVPHPDDAEFYAGGTIARFIKEGFRAFIVTATDGSRGSFVLSRDELVVLRAEEAARAASVLGADPPILLGHPDLELDKLPPGFLREQFIRLIRQHKPDLVISQDPSVTEEVHPDHRAVARAASEAVAFASLPLVHPEHIQDGLNPHFTPEKFYFSDSPTAPNRIIDISSTMNIKLAALAEHKTQMAFLVEDVKRQAALAGLDLHAMFGAELDDPMTAVSWAMRETASRLGQATGVEYGEAFRCIRYHPFVESLLNLSQA